MDVRQQPPRPIAFAPPFIDEATIQAVERVLRSGWITTGPETAAFERELAAYAQVDHVLCGGSWTGLAGVILDWFGVGPGDEVILPSYTYCATANVVLHRGRQPVMVDLPGEEHADGFNLTWAAILPHLTPRTKVVMPVDIGGWPVQVAGWTAALSAWSAEHGFDARGEVQERLGRPLLLSDAAHSLGARIGDAPAASLADIAVFSFHAVKNLTTAEGGAAAISLPPSFDGTAVHATLRTGLLHGQSKDAAAKFQSTKAGAWRYDVERPGFKCNMTDIQAAMGRVALARYPADLARRKALCDRYDAAFTGWNDALLPLRSAAERSRLRPPLPAPPSPADRGPAGPAHRPPERGRHRHQRPLPAPPPAHRTRKPGRAHRGPPPCPGRLCLRNQPARPPLPERGGCGSGRGGCAPRA